MRGPFLWCRSGDRDLHETPAAKPLRVDCATAGSRRHTHPPLAVAMSFAPGTPVEALIGVPPAWTSCFYDGPIAQPTARRGSNMRAAQQRLCDQGAHFVRHPSRTDPRVFAPNGGVRAVAGKRQREGDDVDDDDAFERAPPWASSHEALPHGVPSFDDAFVDAIVSMPDATDAIELPDAVEVPRPSSASVEPRDVDEDDDELPDAVDVPRPPRASVEPRDVDEDDDDLSALVPAEDEPQGRAAMARKSARPPWKKDFVPTGDKPKTKPLPSRSSSSGCDGLYPIQRPTDEAQLQPLAVLAASEDGLEDAVAARDELSTRSSNMSSSSSTGTLAIACSASTEASPHT